MPWAAEFVPLAAALDDMAGQLAAREQNLLDSNGQLQELVNVDGAEGAWLEGGEHVVFFPSICPESQRLVGNVLILERKDGVTVRIEADVPKNVAIRIFRSMR